MTQTYVAMWVPVESLNSCLELGGMQLEPSDILTGQADLMHGSQSTLEPIIRQSLEHNGDPAGELQLIVMISLSQATMLGLETSSNPSSDAVMPSSGPKLRLVSDRSRDITQKRQSATSDPSTNGGG